MGGWADGGWISFLLILRLSRPSLAEVGPELGNIDIRVPLKDSSLVVYFSWYQDLQVKDKIFKASQANPKVME